ncbi:hypothetical protein FVEN_g9215 [Fusarium venenatum]|uniref:Uncharacterized protein n=1 Tax=Fusarium venenatum TaxID=56646 RepID=A0A2L2TSA1_9HYPO|nr:uncharacterized protein FVRRES_00432 [Fusarium venenatum]KAG8352824.1 hypothetical protein FVEN_g9215 [Fusarium venenatum]KAH7006321.1 hypothetical protein EDB82DRAFT_493310 [Fusarium venenatum]CEI63920.1 unnamed protein product [Fusarium venenatum]
MSSVSPPLVSRRRAANIPSDQRSLLEGQDAWAVDLKNQPHGLAHIPGHILEGIKATHLAQKKKSKDQTPQSKKRSATSPVLPASNKRMRNGIATTPKSNSERTPRSSPEKPIPWSPSPERDQPKQAASKKIATDTITQSSIVHETPKTAGGPGLRLRQRHPIPTFQNPPSSESEYDMETRIPDAQPLLNISINQNAVRSNRAVPSPLSTNKPMATPPCAQPSNSTQTSGQDAVVPSKTSPDTNRRVERGTSRPRFKPIVVDASDKKKKKYYPEKERLKATTMPPVINSSRPNSSSESCIPSTYKVPTAQEPVRESIEDKDEEERQNRVEVIIPSTADQEVVGETPSRRPVSAIKPKPVNGTKTAANQDKPVIQQVRQQPVQEQVREQRVQQPTTPTPMGPPKRIASTNSRKPLVNHEVAMQPSSPALPLIAPGAPCEPFETFVQHYPEYASGDGGRVAAATKVDFINACIYLNYLRSKKTLRDCMYDELIRVFPQYYKEYYDQTQKHRIKARVGIKWFNKQRGPPVFNKYLVHRGNLSHILRMYPDEFEANGKLLENEDGDELMIYTSSEDEEESSEEEEEEEEIASPVLVRPDKKTPEASPPDASFESETDMILSKVLSAHVSGSARKLSAAVEKEKEHEMHSDEAPRSEQRSKQKPGKAPEKRPEQRPEKVSKTRPEQRLEQRPERTPDQRPTKKRALPSSFKACGTTLPAQPESSWARDVITQAPPPPSPKIPGGSMPPPSSIPDPVRRRRNKIPGASVPPSSIPDPVPVPRGRDPRPVNYFEKLASKSRASSGSSASGTSTMDDDRRREKLAKYWRKSMSVESPKKKVFGAVVDRRKADVERGQISGSHEK